MIPDDLELHEQQVFLDRVLSRPPARVLDAGCGRGALAARLADGGYVVTGVDVGADEVRIARERQVRAVEMDFLQFEEGLYDVVLFSRSLHHIFPLADALRRAHDLLVPGGTLVCDEFGWERADMATAAWYYERLAQLRADGLIATKREIPNDPDPVQRWRSQLKHDPPLHRGEDMQRGVASLFELRIIESAPYLAFYLCGWVEETQRGYEAVRALLAAERRGIEQGALQPTGLRLVATRKR